MQPSLVVWHFDGLMAVKRSLGNLLTLMLFEEEVQQQLTEVLLTHQAAWRAAKLCGLTCTRVEGLARRYAAAAWQAAAPAACMH